VRKLILFLFILGSANAIAQRNIRLGVHLDPVVSWFTPKSKGIDKDGSRLGISGGLTVESYFRPNYAFYTGISISSLGGNLTYGDSVIIRTGDGTQVPVKAGSTVSYTINYITLPVVVKLKSNEIGYFTYFATLGLAPQVNIGTKAKSTGGQLNGETVPKEINMVNLSYFFGGGIEYNIGGQTALTAGIFYNNSFVDFLSNKKYEAVVNFLTIRLGVIF
jgi:hypothetical protein